MAYLPDDNEKSTKKDILMPVLYVLLGLVGAFNICILSYIGCEFVPWMMNGGNTVAEAQQTAAPAPIPQTQAPATPMTPQADIGQTEEKEDGVSAFEIISEEAGDYGKPLTYNKGTELEETVYAYYVPTGQYTVTNIGEHTSQINVYSNETTTTDAGWKEVSESFDVKRLNVGESAEIDVGDNQHIEIAESSAFKMELKSSSQTNGNSSGATILPITPTIQPAPQTPSQGTAQQAPSGGGNQETYPKDSSKGKYVGSIEKDIYHYPSCRYYDEILPEHLVWFDTVEKAVADGRRACKVCDPPLP